MSQQTPESVNPFDPTGVWKNLRDANMDAWSKMMVQYVNTEAYAKSTGAMLDAWLTGSAPFRQAVEAGMAQAVANLQMPTRADVTRLAERLTNIEMRLDDLEARLDGLRRAGSAGPNGAHAQPTHGENPL